MKHYFYLSLVLLTISLQSMDNNKKRKVDKITSKESDAKRVKKEKLKKEIRQDLDKIHNMLNPDPCNNYYRSNWKDFLQKYKFKKRNKTRPIHTAVKENNIDKIQRILSQKPKQIHAKDDDGNAPINLAVNNNNAEVTKFLLENKADVNTKGHQYASPLHIALKNDNNAMIELLINHHADVHQSTRHRGSPLWVHYSHSPLAIAILRKNLPLVKLMIEHSENFDDLDYPLKQAIKQKNTSIIDYLIEQGAKITDPVITAAKNGDTGMIKYLLAKTDIELNEVRNPKRDPWNKTPLKAAMKNYKFKVVKFLINKKVDVSDEDLNSFIKIHHNSYEDCFQSSNKARKDKIKQQEQPACIIGYLLLKAGANPKRPYPTRFTLYCSLFETINYSPPFARIINYYEKLGIKKIKSAINAIKAPKKLTHKLEKQLVKFDQYVLQLAQKNNYSELEKIVKESMEKEKTQ